ncbi:unnamed protein product [Brugia timori]|uniref:Lipoprotein n=1 Tax=Brugia timori TaxID=42155 RepID=A0A0R3QJQ2_9BILA|nr:unnamed protein product [Brugia timori]
MCTARGRLIKFTLGDNCTTSNLTANNYPLQTILRIKAI